MNADQKSKALAMLAGERGAIVSKAQASAIIARHDATIVRVAGR